MKLASIHDQIHLMLDNRTAVNLVAWGHEHGLQLAGLKPSGLVTTSALCNQVEALLEQHDIREHATSLPEGVIFDCPIATPPSFRDAYCFLTHVTTTRKARGQEVPPAFYEVPPFYFSNPTAFGGAGELAIPRDRQEKLDYELELAIVIKRDGINIPVAEADSYIGAFMILNDWSARKMQGEREMPMMMGPNKSKDFATTCGPYLVTPRALAQRTEKTKRGNVYHLDMQAAVNGKVLSKGNFDSIHYTWAEIIAHVSKDAMLRAGDVIGSGTMGTGCLLELNLTGAVQNLWLKDGDDVCLTVDELGSLENTLKFL